MVVATLDLVEGVYSSFCGWVTAFVVSALAVINSVLVVVDAVVGTGVAVSSYIF